ncbi:hypothetical protein [Pseudoalteromonas luteoviolacea]|uniref:DUF945 domain-containing protein n=1 Tax=Pseudoalteromonas luteoviolacea S4054 TaxID=1129367 RepID=A0A0F6A924_9GAMM|nr:hypothetical protein [Pseudoalteromonas luteoviolacea]AOT06946.1 hypothetical protein S4054249_03215 [Pseudoalteromonas luteoviolacea]AOT11864.1 hypothetical protein S40542_03215 [Pseudoalteromonas luteoviolacea]AOT16776.1 hypothetical protein S4054_03215 [Pseudoalteromonas luteoviolacea]KKE82722.1 hypothetical protein N479_16845 [Pseudoalteromonas luteoviolacea S4054]KZN72933.1 hypothetical protein N481_13850 [Pseudoalteromonas luteoviolacea S4047-1]
MNKAALTGVALAVAGGVAGVNWYANKTASEVVEKQIQQFSEQTGLTVSYQTVDYSLLSNTIVLEQISFKEQATAQGLVEIDRFSLKGYEEGKISPLTELQVHGLSLAPEFKANSVEVIPSILSNAKYNLISSMRYDESSGDSQFALDMSAEQVMSFGMNIALTNSREFMELQRDIQQMHDQGEMTLEAELQMQSKMITTMQALQPVDMSFSLKNEGELKALVDGELQKNGLNHEQLKAMLAMQMENVPASDKAKQAIQSFIAGLSSLEVSMQFPENTSFMQLGLQLQPLAANPQALEEFLKLEIVGS